jgi:hypothetical protein
MDVAVIVLARERNDKANNAHDDMRSLPITMGGEAR